jgi:predicted DNA-binding transcriptional regulator YafY
MTSLSGPFDDAVGSPDEERAALRAGDAEWSLVLQSMAGSAREDLDEPFPAPPSVPAPQRREPPVARLLRLLRSLAAADGARGVAAPDLVAVGGYPAADRDAAMTQLQRDIRRLGQAGWGIDNVAPQGSTARYVLHPNDLAERADLTPGEQSALEAALATRADDALPGAGSTPPPLLAEVRHAVERHCVIEMTYAGTLRRVHPIRLHNPPGRWLMRARDEHDETVKWFLIHKIEDLSLDDPGTAQTDIEDPEDSLNPHCWLIDPPVRAELVVEPEHVEHVRQTLNLPVDVEEAGEEARVAVTVTNRRAFTDWLVTMGLRVRLVGPPDLRDAFLRRLEEVARG